MVLLAAAGREALVSTSRVSFLSAPSPRALHMAPEAPKTLWQALGEPQNRQVALHFAGFSGALAVLPIVGLVVTEWGLRPWVLEANRRWSCSAVVAVLLVQLLLVAFVRHCFQEGFEGEKVGEKEEERKEVESEKGEVKDEEVKDAEEEKDSKKEK